MAKRIIVQARGKGGPRYRVRRRAFRFEVKYPAKLSGEGTIITLFNSSAHTAPLAKVKYSDGTFYMPAFKGMTEGQKIIFQGNEVKEGNIMELGNIPVKTPVYNVESVPMDGGVFIKSAGSYGEVSKVIGDDVYVLLPSKKERKFNKKSRATIGIIAGDGRLDKPIIKAGKMYHMKKATGKLWPRTSAVKMNVIDHPFGSGRGKRIKQKVPKRNAPPGKRVGLVSAKRTGHIK